MKTQDEINNLLSEFESIKTLEKKLSFWKNKIGFEYYDSLEKLQEEQWILPFFIKLDNSHDIEEINNYYIEIFKDRNPNSLLDIDNLINDFKNKLTKIENEKEFIRIEIDRVKSLAEKTTPSFKIKSKFSYYCQEYEDCLLNNKKIDFREKEIKPIYLHQKLNGQTWAEYHLFLESLLNPKKEAKIHTITHVEQMLILEYMGLGKELNNTQRAKLYQPIINRDVKTTRQYFSSLESEKKKANLEYIKELFSNIRLNDIAELVEKDINKYHKKK
jgi:hypothetical protein